MNVQEINKRLLEVNRELNKTTETLSPVEITRLRERAEHFAHEKNSAGEIDEFKK